MKQHFVVTDAAGNVIRSGTTHNFTEFEASVKPPLRAYATDRVHPGEYLRRLPNGRVVERPDAALQRAARDQARADASAARTAKRADVEKIALTHADPDVRILANIILSLLLED